MKIQIEPHSISDTPTASEVDFDIVSMINEQNMTSHFQPILSIKDAKTIGVEALVRATNPLNGQPIPPNRLFEEASRCGLTLELDRLCRKKAIENFMTIAAQYTELLVFINLDVSILNEKIVGSNKIINLLNEYDINPERVVIEFIESKVDDPKCIERFISTHRKRGFLIAIDDMGAGHSNLERIPIMKPDIIKLDRSLISGICIEYHKQELVEFFIKLSHKIGALVIAEGIETQEDALACLERGVDLVQGFFFARPQAPEKLDFMNGLLPMINTGIALKTHIKTQFEKRKFLYKGYNDIADNLCCAIANTCKDNYDQILSEILVSYPDVECAYILHETGTQLSSTIFNPNRKHRNRSSLFAPAIMGTDQSSKDYFLFLGETQRRFVTDPYISKASGNVCVTISTLIKDSSNSSLIVCIDISTNRIFSDC